MWNSFKGVLLKKKGILGINEKDIKIFTDKYFRENFKNLVEDYEVVLKNNIIILKLFSQNPLISKEIKDRQQEIKESVEKNLKVKFSSIEIRMF